MTVLRDYAAQVTQPTLGGESEPVRYDEVVAPDGSLRPAWKGLAELAVGLTDGDLRRVNDEIGRFLADDGVTYARTGGRQGPWRLDPVPLVIDAPSWQPLEVGLAQRAELLNAVLVDLLRQAAAALRAASSRRRWCSGTAASPGSWPGRPRSTRARWYWRPPTWVATPTASGGCSRTVRRRRPASATRWRTAGSSRGCCPSSTARPACTGWSRTSGRSAPR